MSVAIVSKESGAVLVEAEGGGPQIVRYEGNLYFAPEAVKSPALRVTERTGTCPYKGTYHWVDLEPPGGTPARNVAWVYADPKPGHEAIRGRFGFYAGDRGATRQEGNTPA